MAPPDWPLHRGRGAQKRAPNFGRRIKNQASRDLVAARNDDDVVGNQLIERISQRMNE